MKCFLKDGQPVRIREVNEELTKAFGQENMYELCFEFVCELGASITSEMNTYEVTPKIVEEYIVRLQKQGEVHEHFVKFIRKYQPFVDGTIFQFHARE